MAHFDRKRTEMRACSTICKSVAYFAQDSRMQGVFWSLPIVMVGPHTRMMEENRIFFVDNAQL